MPKFECENPELRKVMLELYDLVVENGGYIHDGVTVQEADGELSILSSLPHNSHEELITIPEKCLPRIDDFVITVHGDKLFAKPKSDIAINSQLKAMELMIEIYNLTNKLVRHRDTNIWLSLRKSPEILQEILKARSRSPKIIKYYEKYENGKFDELLIDTFIGTRVLRYESSDKSNRLSCLVPFIDFANHSIESPVILNGFFKTDAVSMINFVPGPESNECYYRYGFLDAIDSLLIYGFSDVSSPIVRSIPLQYNFHIYGHIQVNALVPQIYSEHLEDSVQDLYFYMPYVNRIGRDEMELSHLIIPGETAPKALRRVLEYRIESWKPTLKPAVVKDIVSNFENVIINKNIEYYDRLLRVVSSVNDNDVSSNYMKLLNTLIETQTEKLHEYQTRIGKLN